MMACYLIYRDRLEPRAAIARVRAARRCSVETDAQEDAVTEWALLMQVTGYRLAPTYPTRVRVGRRRNEAAAEPEPALPR